MIIKYVVLIIGTVFELYSTNLYISSFLKRKAHIKPANLIGAYILILLFQIFASIFSKGVILLLCSFITAFLVCCLYISKSYTKLILAITAIVINIVSELITSGFIMIFQTIDFSKIDSDPYLFALGTLISKFIMFALILIINIRKVRFNAEDIETRHLLILSVLPITTIFIIISMYQVMFMVESVNLKIMFVVSSAMIIFSNFVTFHVVNRQNRLAKTEYELNLLKENINEQAKHYRALQKSHEEIREMRHNMRSMCLATIAELQAGNLELAIEHIKNNMNVIEETNRIIDTGHPSIDTILESKLNKCKELNITTNIVHRYNEKININEIEISVIIGNILDNAIEACQKNQSAEGEILGTISVDKQNIIIQIMNTAMDSNNFKTSKSNPREHGYGLKSISHIAKKYNGYSKFSFADNIFSSYVILEN